MNGSADCELSSPMATDEEPPGPLDLSSSILSTISPMTHERSSKQR